MGANVQAFDIFQTPLSSHYPLPLIVKIILYPEEKNFILSVTAGSTHYSSIFFYIKPYFQNIHVYVQALMSNLLYS